MAIENLREIGNVLYEQRADGMLYPVRRIRPDMEAQGVKPQTPGILDVGGLREKLTLLNKTFNPVEAIGQSMRAGERMMSSDVPGWDRVAALGDMLSGVAGVTAPAAALARTGAPAATALMEGLLGWSPTREAVGDTARSVGRDVVDRLNQRGPMPVLFSNPIIPMRAQNGMESIRAKVDEVSDLMMNAYGIRPSISSHPTSWGNSVYLTAKIPGPGRTYSKVGFRLSDHDVGEFRRATDEVQTIIDDPRLTSADLLSRIDEQHKKSMPVLAEMAKSRAEDEAASSSALNAWGLLSGDQKGSISSAYKNEIEGRFQKPWKFLSAQEKANYARIRGILDMHPGQE